MKPRLRRGGENAQRFHEISIVRLISAATRWPVTVWLTPPAAMRRISNVDFLSALEINTGITHCNVKGGHGNEASGVCA